MDFELTEEHIMLKESAASFVKKEHSFNRLRELKNNPWGYSKDFWKKMADLGWTGLIYPEPYGGSGLDFGFVMVLLEEFGRGLLPEPWISNVLLGGNLVYKGGSESQRQEILPGISSGDLFVTVAYLEEGGRYDPSFCKTTVKKNGGAFSISGKKIFVIDGCSADRFVVTTRSAGAVSDTEGITLFLIPRDKTGIGMTSIKTMDGRNACILELKDVSVSEADMIGEMARGYPLLTEVLDEATIGVCCEMVGGMNASLDMTVAYLCERVQFGRAIGSFQAVQHKTADMFIQKELATSVVRYAVASIESKIEDRAISASLAKAKCSSAYTDITKMAIQLFGAIGFTNEADIGFFLKRAKVAETLYGDADYHLDRYGALKGY